MTEKDVLLNLWLRDLGEIGMQMKGSTFPDRGLILTLRPSLSLGETRKDVEQNMMTETGTATEVSTEIETEGTGATSGMAEDGNQGLIGTAVLMNAIEDSTGMYLNGFMKFRCEYL